MALEEPQLGLHVELGHDPAQAMLTAIAGDVRDAIEHQHRRQRQAPGIRSEQLALAGGDQLLVGKGIGHYQTGSTAAGVTAS
ncbi:hypothetical protein D3C85_1678630 [compost metagenome]